MIREHLSTCRVLSFLSGLLMMSIGLHPAGAIKLGTLPLLSRPLYMVADQDYLYVVEQPARVHLCTFDGQSLAFQRILEIKGEGPGELQSICRLEIQPDHILIPGLHKLARFTRNGDFMDEVNLNMRLSRGEAITAGKGWLVRNLDYRNDDVSEQYLLLIPPDFSKPKVVGRQRLPREKNGFNPERPFMKARVWRNRIYVLKSHIRTTLEVYSLSGAELETIHLPLPSLEVDEKLESFLTKRLLTVSRSSERAKRMLSRIRFPRQIPALDWFTIQDGRLIARTYAFQANQVEFVIMDLEGRVQHRVFLPDTGRTSYGIRFLFFQDHYYWLEEDPDDDGWAVFKKNVF